jgi:hypothetical protein
MISEELPIYKKTLELVDVLLDSSEKFSRFFRYTIGESLVNRSIELLDLIMRINMEYSSLEDRISFAENFIREFNMVKTLIRICIEKHEISLNKGGEISMLTESIGKQSTAWKNSLIKKGNTD